MIIPLFGGSNHPELEWKTLESRHFFVHFHNGTERTAKAALDIAEFVYTPATEMYSYQPKQKTHIIIRDTDDFSNGSAFFFDNKRRNIKMYIIINKVQIAFIIIRYH